MELSVQKEGKIVLIYIAISFLKQINTASKKNKFLFSQYIQIQPLNMVFEYYGKDQNRF